MAFTAFPNSPVNEYCCIVILLISSFFFYGKPRFPPHRRKWPAMQTIVPVCSHLLSLEPSLHCSPAVKYSLLLSLYCPASAYRLVSTYRLVSVYHPASAYRPASACYCLTKESCRILPVRTTPVRIHHTSLPYRYVFRLFRH